jgi:preprotein translocase subunit YajC
VTPPTLFLAFLFQQQAQPNPLVTALPMVLIFGIFYFLLFMPMQRQKKQQKEMLEGLKNGDLVVTTGGLIGTVFTIHPDETIVLRVKPDNTKLLVTRSAIAGLVTEAAKPS